MFIGGERKIYMGGSMGERVFFVVRVKFRIFSRLSVGVTQRKNEENNKLIKQNKTVFNTETKTEEDNLLRLINIFVKAVCVCFLGRGETKWGCGVVVYVKIMIEVFSLNLLGKWLLFYKIIQISRGVRVC
jgi:hypothetical protein